LIYLMSGPAREMVMPRASAMVPVRGYVFQPY
jgi:hypothetical protein